MHGCVEIKLRISLSGVLKYLLWMTVSAFPL